MNRLKSAPRTPLSTYLILVVSFVIIAFGGIRHAMFKNRQVQVSREIDACERRIEQQQLDIRTIQMRSETLLDRFTIRDRLAESGSNMRPIPIGLAEEVKPSNQPSAIATTLP
jgi:hypothetical protein